MPLLPDDPTPTLLEALQEFQRDMAAARPSSRFSFATVPWREIYTGRWTPDTNAQTTAADDGRRFWPIGPSRPSPIVCLDIEPEDL